MEFILFIYFFEINYSGIYFFYLFFEINYSGIYDQLSLIVCRCPLFQTPNDVKMMPGSAILWRLLHFVECSFSKVSSAGVAAQPILRHGRYVRR